MAPIESDITVWWTPRHPEWMEYPPTFVVQLTPAYLEGIRQWIQTFRPEWLVID